MNYIVEINKFEHQNNLQPLSPAAQLLWYRLMHCANKNRWPEQFSCSNAELMRSMHVSSKVLHAAQAELISSGFISYEAGSGRTAGQYILHTLGCPERSSLGTGDSAQSAKKEKNQKKEIYNKQFYKQNNDAESDSKEAFYAELERRARLKLNGKEHLI